MSALPVDEIPFTFDRPLRARDRLSVAGESRDADTGGGGGREYRCICGCNALHSMTPEEQLAAHTPEERAEFRRWLDAKSPPERRAHLAWLLGADDYADASMPEHARRARDALYARLDRRSRRGPGGVEYSGGR